MPHPFLIKPARAAAELEAILALFRAYEGSLGIDLSYQDFADELSSLPGKYAPPQGELYLAVSGAGEMLGCVGLRPLEPGICEMKRLYVTPSGRGLGLGRALVEQVLKRAGEIGYREMRLDTLPTMTAAISMYQKMGFSVIEPYYETPVAGTIFMSRQLESAG